MPEVGDGRPAGCKPAALVHPQSDSGLWLASPASAKGVPPPLRKAGAWFESRRKHRCFPLWKRPLPSPQPRLGCRFPAAGVTRSRPRLGRPVGIHHSRPRNLTRHGIPCVSTFARSRPDPTPLPPRPERHARKAVTACRALALPPQPAWPPGRPPTRTRSLVLIAKTWAKTPTVTERHRANTRRRRRSA
jgi:hypothetical protein